MEPQEIRDVIAFLQARVRLEATEDEAVIAFAAPTVEEMAAAGLDRAGAQRILAADWWEEMVEEIVDTPGFCPGEPAETVLAYARDVVLEYIGKRFDP